MQIQTIDIELLIKRFIRRKISKLNPRDEDYAIQFLKDEFNKMTKNLAVDKVIESLYQKYRFGYDILEILNDTKFYYTLSFEKYPMLFKIENSVVTAVQKVKRSSSRIKNKQPNTEQKSLEAIQQPPVIKLIEEQIPFVKKVIVRQTKQYIAFMEFKSWIHKNGLTLPRIDAQIKLETASESPSSVDLITITIENYLISFKENNKISEFDFTRLVSLLERYFKENQYSKLETPIFVKYGVTKKFAFALGEIYRELKTSPLSYEYLLVGKNNISLFNKVDVARNNYFKSKLYKYYSSKPKK
jgi:hypothetical protein